MANHLIFHMTDEEIKAAEAAKAAEQEEQRKKDLAEEERLKNLKIEDDEEDGFDWKADALKHRAIADRLKGKLAKVAPITRTNEEHKVDEEITKDVAALKQAEAKRQFGFEHGLSPQETDHAFRFANGKPTKETLEDPFFKSGLEGLRTKERLEKNLPGSNSRSSVFKDKSFAESSEEDRKKSFEKRVKEIQGA